MHRKWDLIVRKQKQENKENRKRKNEKEMDA